MLAQYLILFLAGAVELWVAIPIGFALNLPAPIICIIVSVGSILGITVAAFLGEKLRSFILSKRTDQDGKPKGRAYRIWQKYGVVGYSLLAPALTGAVFGSALGIALGAERGKLILWLSVGAVVWIVALTAAVSLGVLVISTM